MGLSSSKQKATSESQQQQTGTTTPINPSWVTDSIMDYTGRIGSMLDADPNSFVAGASPLQQRAWNATDRLGLWTGNSNAASNMAAAAGNAGANLMPSSAGYTAARGNASTYTAPTLANPREAVATGYNPAQAGAASLLDNFSAYQNPYNRQVVDTTLADFDQQAGQTRAAQAANAARTGAFGGSRYGIREAQTEGELARARAATQAGLLDQGFRTAAGLSQDDAGRRQQSGLFNADAQNQAGAFGASASNNASLANQGASNQFALTQAGLQNDVARYGADANNQFKLDTMGRQDAAAQFGAASRNAMEQFNAGQMETGLARQLQAAGLLNGFGNDYANNTQRDIALMSDLGGQQRAIEQAYAMAPVGQLQMGGSLFGTNPWGIFSGQTVNTNGTSSGTNTTTSSASLFDQLLAAGQLAATVASDRRLKKDIELVGETAHGLGLYRYSYIWEDRPRLGVMADEVAKVMPEAVSIWAGPYLGVDYAALGLSHLVEA
jgi:hypothetical protein